jgi:tripartite ATP-independent transporter DctP family solute receptor
MNGFISSRRNFLMGAATAAGSLCAPALAFGQSVKPIRLRVSSSLTTDEFSEHYVWFRRFADNLQASVGERIKLDYFPNGQLGAENDVAQQVKTGTVDIMISGSSYWATVVPEVGMLDLGYLFDSYDQQKRHLHGAVGKRLAQVVYDRSKVTILGWTSTFGARNIYTKKPVASLADVKNVKIRVLPAPTFIQTIEAMGAIPTPIAMNELYTALQTGIVDGFEQNAGTVLGMKLYETTKNCYLSEHMFLPISAAASPRVISTMPADLLPAFLQAAQEASVYQYAETPAKVQKATDELVKLGVKYSPMTPGDRKAVRQEVTRKVWDPFTDKYPLTKPLIAEIDNDRT